MTELTQEQKFALRLKQISEEPGLYTIQFYVTPEKVIEFWLVDVKKVEGVKKEGLDKT